MLILPTDRERFMRMALSLARKGAGKTNPNPMVGAVVVKEGVVLGNGYHKRAGGPHAEINALKEAGERAKGADIYITLEPCCHYGKTPPCYKALISKGIARAFIGMEDPNPVVSGEGIKLLRAGGVEVEVGILKDKCSELNEAYIKYITTSTPFVTLKLAATLDGKIATFSGESKWITNETSRKKVHKMRGSLDGIMVGVGTVIRDDPQLTNRFPGGKNPHRIVIDSELRIPLNAKILKKSKDVRVLIVTTYKAPLKKVEKLRRLGANLIFLPLLEDGVDLQSLMVELGKLQMVSLLIEGGARLATSSMRRGVVDKLSIFFAPKILGGLKSVPMFLDLGIDSLDDAILMEQMKLQKIGGDILVEGYVKRSA